MTYVDVRLVRSFRAGIHELDCRLDSLNPPAPELFLAVPKVPLIGVGGVATGREAYQKIRAGASLVQVLLSL